MYLVQDEVTTIECLAKEEVITNGLCVGGLDGSRLSRQCPYRMHCLQNDDL